MNTRPLSIWPPPHEPRRTPWRPDDPPPLPPVIPPPVPVRPIAPSQWTVIDTGQDWLAERLLDRRIVSLSGRLDPAAANHAAAALALLDASGDEPIELRLCDVDADLDIAVALLDTLDLVGVPLHATCLGEIRGAAVAILAVADRRTAGAHTTVHLREPQAQLSGHADHVATWAEEHSGRLRLLHERIAGACGRSVDTVAADMRAGRILTAEQARDYGLIDVIGTGRSRSRSGVQPGDGLP